MFAVVCLLLPVQFHTLSSLANWVCLCLLLCVACTVSYFVITGKLGLFTVSHLAIAALTVFAVDCADSYLVVEAYSRTLLCLLLTVQIHTWLLKPIVERYCVCY